jgi:hypothetical protein
VDIDDSGHTLPVQSCGVARHRKEHPENRPLRDLRAKGPKNDVESWIESEDRSSKEASEEA